MHSGSAVSKMFAAVATALLVFAVSGSPLAWAATSKRASLKTLAATLDDDPSGQAATLLVTGELPANAPLPATIELPIPKGATVSWTGQILGGPPASDPKAAYTLIKGKTFDLVRFTLTKARIGQVEIPSAGAVTVSGATRRLALSLPIPYPVGLATLNMKAPSDAKVTKASPGLAPTPGSGGLTYYTLSRSAPRSGVLTAELTYSGGTVPQGTGSGSTAGVQGGQGGVPGQQPAASPGSSLVLPAAVAALAALAVAGFFLVRDRAPETATVDEADDSDVGEEDDEEESKGVDDSASEDDDVEDEEEEAEAAQDEEDTGLESDQKPEPRGSVDAAGNDDEAFFFYDDDEPEVRVAAATSGATPDRPPVRRQSGKRRGPSRSRRR